jgi:hypothetical protein
MSRSHELAFAIAAILALAPAAVDAQPLSVEVWTDKGNEAVYQPGEQLFVSVQSNLDAHLLLYEIDAEGRVTVLFPIEGFEDIVEGGKPYDIPDAQTGLELVVQGPTGQGYVVAIVSRQPFEPLPWYLRPFDAQAEALGYHGVADEEEGVTADGKIVGDPFVAMEKIRRRVVTDDQNPDAFATSYTTYYAHEAVKYPRYMCYDCHRPGHWQWWAGFDPYYATCSAFTFQINYGWYWGPGYWFGYVPRYAYVCQPGYGWGGHYWYSGWSGWNTWCATWGGPLVRFKSKPPVSYVPPHLAKDERGNWRNGQPPGLLSSHVTKGNGARERVALGRNQRSGGEPTAAATELTAAGRDRRAGRQPLDDVRGVSDGRPSAGSKQDLGRVPGREVRPGLEGGSTSERKGGMRRFPAREVRPGVDGQRGANQMDVKGAIQRAPAREARPGMERAPIRLEKPFPGRSGAPADRPARRISARAPAEGRNAATRLEAPSGQRGGSGAAPQIRGGASENRAPARVAPSGTRANTGPVGVQRGSQSQVPSMRGTSRGAGGMGVGRMGGGRMGGGSGGGSAGRSGGGR